MIHKPYSTFQIALMVAIDLQVFVEVVNQLLTDLNIGVLGVKDPSQGNETIACWLISPVDVDVANRLGCTGAR